MINIRQILIIALLIVGFWLLRRVRRRLIAHRQKRSRRQLLYNEMVRCAHCRVHVPRARAVGDSRSGYFCNDQHRLAQQTVLNQDSG